MPVLPSCTVSSAVLPFLLVVTKYPFIRRPASHVGMLCREASHILIGEYSVCVRVISLDNYRELDGTLCESGKDIDLVPVDENPLAGFLSKEFIDSPYLSFSESERRRWHPFDFGLCIWRYDQGLKRAATYEIVKHPPWLLL